MAFFRQELAIDLGTANTVIFKDDQVVLDEPSIIALESKTDALYAIGVDSNVDFPQIVIEKGATKRGIQR